MVVETENGAIIRHLEVKWTASLGSDDCEQTTRKFRSSSTIRRCSKSRGRTERTTTKSATELMNLMPEAFLWKVESQTPESITLSYRPNPNFDPPDMEARVMGAMSGTLVVTNPSHRIRTFKGRLDNDVTIGFGFLARIKAGSTFDIERREVGPGVWQIAETHVHITGHALFFKTIGTQEDEVKSDFSLVPPGTTLEQAVGLLARPARQGGAAQAKLRK